METHELSAKHEFEFLTLLSGRKQQGHFMSGMINTNASLCTYEDSFTNPRHRENKGGPLVSNLRIKSKGKNISKKNVAELEQENDNSGY